MTCIQSERLHIHELSLDDDAFVLRLLNEPSFIHNIADRGVRSLDDARGYLRDGPLASYAANGFGLWRVSRREDGSPIGICGLIRRETLDDVDIGYALLPEYCGSGLAREAAAAVLRHARERLRLARVVAVVNPDNRRSIHLLERLGFGYERMVRLDPEWPPIKLFGLDIADLNGQTTPAVR